jgi:Domain of unknown function (DUF5134)
LTAAPARVDARPVLPSPDTPHPRDLLVWHCLAALGMTVMLTFALPSSFAETGVGVFAFGIVWCLVQAVRRSARTPYFRLAVCCLAMVVMLLPQHASAEHMAPSAWSAGRPGMVSVVLVAALLGVAVAGLARTLPTTGSRTHRALGLVEGVLAAGMAAMVAGAV